LPQSDPRHPDPRQLTKWVSTARDTRELLELHKRHHAAFNHIHISAAWMALGRLSQSKARAGSRSKSGYVRYRPMPPKVHELLLPLMRQTMEMATEGQLGGRELANVLYGAARARISPGADKDILFAVLTSATATRVHELKPQECSNSAWALATAGHDAPAFLTVLGKAALVHVDAFSPQELCNLAWAYATAKHEDPRLFRALADAAMVQVHEFKAQNLANLAWALATNGHRSPLLLDALAEASTVQISSFNTQNLANTVWAYSTLGHAAPELYNAVTIAVGRKVGAFKPQELASIAWSFAKACHVAPALFEALADTAAKRGVADFKPQGVARTVWAFALAGHASPALFDALASVGEPQLHDFHPPSLAMTAWAYATTNHSSPFFLSTMAREATVVARDGRFSPEEITNLAWSYATLQYPAPELLEALVDAAADTASGFEPQQVTMLLRALETAGHPPSRALLAALAPVVGRGAVVGPEQLKNILIKHGVRLIDLFREWDDDNNGSIDKRELRTAIAALGYEAPKSAVDAFFDSLDDDGNGMIEFHELEAALTDKALDEARKKRAAKKATEKVAAVAVAVPVPAASTPLASIPVVHVAASSKLSVADATVSQPDASLDADITHAPVVMMSWNEFRASVKGQGLPVSQVSKMYQEHKAAATAT